MQFGLVDPPWWVTVMIALGLTHVTITAVTLYLHRHLAHRALDLHPAMGHFFRFWLWLTTGMVTRQWVAIHRKHHAHTETGSDPHSPQTHGIRKVLLEGAELYREESRNRDCIETFGHGTPDDWIERRVYSRHPELGVSLMLGSDLLLLGPIGLTVWAVQMLWIPFFAAGVVNGIGHYWGYRNFAPDDASTNILPLGLLLGGEELHNNHHACIGSARFSRRWWEFDLGWLYIRLLEQCHLAKVRRVAPAIHRSTARAQCDEANVLAVLLHRHHLLAQFARAMRRTVEEAVFDPTEAPRSAAQWRAARRWLRHDGRQVDAEESQALKGAIQSSATFATIHALRGELAALWRRSNASSTELAQQLEAWCRRAEQCGIAPLSRFARTVRCYDLAPGHVR